MNPTNPPIINPNPPATGGPTAGIQPTDLMAEIQKQLLSTSGAISSTSSKIEDTITGAIAKTEEAGKAAKAGTESAFNREIANTTEKGVMAETSFLESQRGYATNTAALKDLRTSNEKSIRDLEQRKQEVMLQGDVATASKISDLILQKYDFEQKATQQVFQNLISLSNVASQSAQEARLAKTQAFTEEQAISNVALKYGIEVKPGETFADVVNRAKPFASAEQKLQLDKMTADLELTKANITKAKDEATKALRDSKAVAPMDAQSIQVIAQNLKDAGGTANAIKAQLATAAGITDKAAAYAIVDALFKPQTVAPKQEQNGSGLVNDLTSFGTGVSNFSQGIYDYIFGAGNVKIPGNTKY